MIYAFNIGFLEVSFVDILDIGFLSLLLYHVYKLIRGSVAIKIFVGFLFVYLTYLVVRAVNMELLSFIIGRFMEVGVIAVIILFQQEIRKFLMLLGKTTIFDEGNVLTNIKNLWSDRFDKYKLSVTPVMDAIKTLSGSNTGALIVFSRDSELKFFADSGDRLEALISKRLILAIFNKLSPLHDGAIIINQNKVIAARCILPVSERDDIPAQFGLRHRAALGMSENTDCIVVIISEETGQISLAKNGELLQNLSTKEIRKSINNYHNSDNTVKVPVIEEVMALVAKDSKEEKST